MSSIRVDVRERVKVWIASSPLPKSRLLHGVSYLTALQMARIGVTLTTSALLLRYFGPSQKGILAIAMSLLGMACLLRLQTGQALQTMVPKLLEEREGWSIRTLLWQTFFIKGVLTVLVSAALALGVSWIAGFYAHINGLRQLIVILAVTNLFDLFNSPMDQGALIALDRPRQVLVLGALDLIGTMVATIVTLSFHLTMAGYLLATGVASLLSIWYGWACFASLGRDVAWNERKPSEPGAKALFKRLVKFSIPVSVMGILFQLSIYLSTLIAGRLFSTDQVGFYAFAVATIGNLWSLVSLPQPLLIPRFAQAYLKGEEVLASLADRAWRGMLLYASMASALVMVFAPEITRLLAGQAFLEAVPILQLLALQSVFRSIEVLRLVFYAQENPLGILKRFVIKSLVEVIGYLVLIPRLGMMGLVLASIISYIVWGLMISFGAFSRFSHNLRAILYNFSETWMAVFSVTATLGFMVAFSALASRILAEPHGAVIVLLIRVAAWLIGSCAVAWIIWGRSFRLKTSS